MSDQPAETKGGQIVPAYAAVMPAPQGGALPTGLEWQALERMAQTLADSDLIPYRLKRKPGDVAVILLAAREYGIPPLMALSKLPVVNGTPAPMGELMIALVLRAGHYIAADFRNPDGSVYMGGAVTPQHYGEARYKRADWPEREVMTFTLDEALTAGLIDRITADGKAIARVTKTKNGGPVEEVTPWEQYTPNMARWRAVANACRLAFADVLMGLSYLPEELGAIVDADGAPIEAEVVGPRGGATGTLEQRTAQESADKLAEQPWHDGVIDALRRTATEGGYLDTLVTYQEDRMTFAEALTRHVEDRKHADTVDAELVEDTPAAIAESLEGPDWTVEAVAEAEANAERRQIMDEPIKFRGNSMTLGGALALRKIDAREQAEKTAPDAQDGATAPSDPAPGHEEPPVEPVAPPTSAPPAAEHGTGQTLAEAAQEVAVEALTTGDLEHARGLYRGSSDLLGIDVRAVVTVDDLETIGMDPGILEEFGVPLGGLLLKVGGYIERHSCAVRSAPVEPGDGLFDPWADGSASGTPPTDPV